MKRFNKLLLFALLTMCGTGQLKTHIVVYDLQGRKSGDHVQRFRLDERAELETTFNVQLPKGVYVLMQGKTVKKIVKQ